jgi:pimeloyl-ACP methyl ester carboxylesterase
MPTTINDGLRIHYEVVGSGEPLLLYHGLTGSGERWRDTGYIAGLAEAYRLILIDARGHGQSDKPTIKTHMAGSGRRPTSSPC